MWGVQGEISGYERIQRLALLSPTFFAELLFKKKIYTFIKSHKEVAQHARYKVLRQKKEAG